LTPYSLMRRITIGLTATMLIASLCGFGWLYIKSEWTNAALHKQTLLDQARVIASYLSVNNKNGVSLHLPPRLAEAYSNPESAYRYAVRDADGQFLFDSGMAVAPLPDFAKNHLRLYDYDPDGPGPIHVFGAALQTEVGHRTLFVQVEQQAHDPAYVRKAVVDEFIVDGGWLEILFLFVLLGVCIWIVKRAIAPIKRISTLAESIGPTSANIRLPVDRVPLEILPLVRSMNAALDRLEQGLQQQREFNANAAHQLRTPLSVLMANLDTLTELEIAARLRTDVEHMSRIVSQLLLAARLETLSINLDEIVDLNDIAADVAGNLAPLAVASAKSIELIRSDGPVVIRTSTFALKAALGNLIENAIRHTPEGTAVRLHVTDRPSIEVIDHGPGVPVEQRVRIFERFWRGDRSIGGAGLGLAIVERIMKALQGSVLVDKAPGGGALFVLIFPLAAVLSSVPKQEQPLAVK
jgi:signal transduction histidine kinase